MDSSFGGFGQQRRLCFIGPPQGPTFMDDDNDQRLHRGLIRLYALLVVIEGVSIDPTHCPG